MSYLVLARKFRPQTFSSIVGQEHITTALANAILRDRVPHALLFTGPRGVGKTTSARVFAKALNCSGREIKHGESDEAVARESVEPCGECSNCVEIARSSSMAVWEIDGASNNSVDNVRELIDSLYSLPPPGSPYKIYIIDEVHMLSTAAFNALLKSLEEPPPNTIFVFATTEPQKIPETVISRCQRHDFRQLPHTVIVDSLRSIASEEKIDVEDSVFDFIARRAQGGMRDAQSLFDRVIGFGSGERIDLTTTQRIFGVLDRKFYFSISEAVFAQDTDRVFSLIDEAFKQSIDLRSFLSDFLSHWRNLLIYALSGEERKKDLSAITQILGISAEELAMIEAQMGSATSFDLQRLFDLAEKTTDAALRTQFPRYVIEAGVAKMATLGSLRPLAEVIAAVESGDFAVASTVASTPVFTEAATGAATGAVPSAPALAPQASFSESGPSEISEPLGSSEPDEGDFNPSWEAFVTHVKGRSEMILAAFLRRVSPRTFKLGDLELEASAFDLKSLKDKSSTASLKQCLHSYSGESDWDISFKEIDATSSPEFETVQNLEGSLASKEKKEKIERAKRIEKEARGDDLVKDALATFEGSTGRKGLGTKDFLE